MGLLKRISIDAEAHSDDRAVKVEFDASPYFYAESENGNLKQVLENLDGCNFGCDYPADCVAEFFSENETHSLFVYMAINGGFECNIGKAAVIKWLEAFAPEYMNCIKDKMNV
ncbi:MAG: hypothetical protein V3T17_11210 [Pseudomonadales bacterium]